MRIGIDLQPLQTVSSRGRGVGNFTYNQIKRILQLDDRNTYSLFVNAYLSDPAPFGLYDKCNWRKFFLDFPIDTENGRSGKREGSQYAAFLEDCATQHKLDLLHFTNPFEWELPIPSRLPSTSVVVTVYDLIPLVFEEQYLKNAPAWLRRGYRAACRNIARADRIVTISECSKKDLIKLLGVREEKIDVVHAGPSGNFRVLEDKTGVERVKRKFGIDKDFILCTGGFDYRKNLERVIESYNLLPPECRRGSQLVIVCRLLPEEEATLRKMAETFRIGDDLVLTNYVTDEELVALYNGATLLLFPSLYEGFGLPVLDAMTCGTPVVTSKVSSLPEVAGDAAILVDPYDVRDIAEAVERVLTNPQLQAEMREKGFRQARKFTWDRVAQATIQAYEKTVGHPHTVPRKVLTVGEKLKIAYFSPLSPQRSGVADYSEELLPSLAEHADIEIFIDDYRPSSHAIVSQFAIHNYREYEKLAQQGRYHVNLYQMGNSVYHEYIYKMALQYPGVVVLHDVILHGLVHYMTVVRGNPSAYVAEMAFCHGQAGREEALKAVSGVLPFEVYGRPLNKRVVNASLGIIVHSDWAREQLLAYDTNIPIAKINHGVRLDRMPTAQDRARLRAELGLEDGHFVIASFGHIASPKRTDVALRAFARFRERHPEAVFILVGEVHPPTPSFDIPRLIKELGLERYVQVTGYVDLETFMKYISITDLALNLRYPTAGETSGSLLRLLAMGIPVLVSNVNQFKEFPDDCCWKVDVDETEEDLLLAYMQELADNELLRWKMGQNARCYILENDYSWESVARAYVNFIQQVLSR